MDFGCQDCRRGNRHERLDPAFLGFRSEVDLLQCMAGSFHVRYRMDGERQYSERAQHHLG